MVVARVRMNKQNSNAYALAFKKMFDKCLSINPAFEHGSTLLGVLIDWSDAEANGLLKAVGKTVAENLLKKCKVHWIRSCQRVAELPHLTTDKKKKIFSYIYATPSPN